MTKTTFKGLIDTTLRDGQESPLLFDSFKYHFSLDDKKQILRALIELGVNHFEFFSPVVSQTEKRHFQQIKKDLKTLFPKKRIRLAAHCRCHPKDIEQALKAGFNGLHLYMGLSDSAQRFSYNKDLKTISTLVKKTVAETRKKHPHLYLRYSAEDAFRTPLKNIFQVYDRISPYVDTLGMPDTTGMATPEMVKTRVKALKKRYPQNNLECHFHNDQGYALINTITAIKANAEYADTSVWGLAERSGIASLTGVLLDLYFLKKNYVRKYNLKLCYPLNVLMGSILKRQVPFTEPVSLTNRTHIAGVHQKAVLNNKRAYEGHSLDKFGVTQRQLLLGPLAGWHFVDYYLKEIKGFSLTEKEAKAITKEFKNKMGKTSKKNKPEKILLAIAEKYSLSKTSIPKKHQAQRKENF